MEEDKERTEYCSTVNYNWITQRCSNAANVPNALPLGGVRYQDEAKFDSTTPRLTLDWQATDNLMVYGIFAQGAKPGGLNGIAGQSIGLGTYEQEESDNFELGSKYSMFDNRLRLSAAAYFTQATDVQFTQSVPSATGQGAVTSVATNQGEGEIMGLEFEIEAAITEAITLSAGYGYTDTEITKGCDDFEYTLNTGGLIYDPALGNVPECSIKGNRYPLGAEDNANFVLNYDAPTQFGQGLSWISNFSVTYEGSKYVQVHNLAETGETTLVNLRLGIRSDDGWSIVAFGRNLTDEDTIPLATRWFDLRTGSTNITPGVPCNPATATVPCGPPATSPAGYPVTGAPGTAGGADTGSPRAFFGRTAPWADLRYRVQLRLQALSGTVPQFTGPRKRPRFFAAIIRGWSRPACPRTRSTSPSMHCATAISSRFRPKPSTVSAPMRRIPTPCARCTRSRVVPRPTR